MQIFFADDIESDFCTLNEEESLHCVKVLRLSVGDELHLTDGRGTLCRCRIADPHPKHCSVTVEERLAGYGKHSFYLHLAVAPTKNTARIEWLVEKAVEMGVDEITPLLCDHSERCVLRQERLERISVSAMKQSLKAYKPLINAPTPLADLIALSTSATKCGQRFIAYCDGEHRTPLHDAYIPGSNALILIGPEGDFSPAEVTAALDAGFLPVTLGNSRLRTETAAIAATAFFNLIN